MMDDKSQKATMYKGEEVAKSFVAEVRDMANRYGINFFVVTDGASGCNICGISPAVRHARNEHIKWERKNGIDPNHDWSI